MAFLPPRCGPFLVTTIPGYRRKRRPVPQIYQKNCAKDYLNSWKICKQFSINDAPPTIDELQKALNELKTKKANNDVDPDLFKRCDHQVMLEVLHRMSNNMWEKLDIAVAWGNSRLKTR